MIPRPETTGLLNHRRKIGNGDQSYAKYRYNKPDCYLRNARCSILSGIALLYISTTTFRHVINEKKNDQFRN